MSATVTNRHEFVLLFDVKNGNPNGDPDAGNLPRTDPESGHGLVTDAAIKRRLRNFVALAKAEAPGHRIYVSEGASLNELHQEAWHAVVADDLSGEGVRKLPKETEKSAAITRWMCDNFWDVRTFGAVMSTSVNAGQVRGPVQLGFARSVEPVHPMTVTITRMAQTARADMERKAGPVMARRHIVPYGLYRIHGFVSAPLCSHPVKGTGFCEADLELLWQGLVQMFDHDRSSTRGEMAARKLIVFRHASALGSASAQSLFDRVKVLRRIDGHVFDIENHQPVNWPAARSWNDYEAIVERADMPAGISVHEIL